MFCFVGCIVAITATLATAEVSAGAVAGVDQNVKSSRIDQKEWNNKSHLINVTFVDILSQKSFNLEDRFRQKIVGSFSFI